jgi:hypothetical protein
MDPGTVRTRPRDATGPILDRGMTAPRDGSAILILGSCRDDAFVADRVLIEAATLEAETVIRRWLSQHDIRLATSARGGVSVDWRESR